MPRNSECPTNPDGTKPHGYDNHTNWEHVPRGESATSTTAAQYNVGKAHKSPAMTHGEQSSYEVTANLTRDVLFKQESQRIATSVGNAVAAQDRDKAGVETKDHHNEPSS